MARTLGTIRREPDPGEQHRSEDRIPDEAEGVLGDEFGLLFRIHADAPTVAHTELRQKGAEDADQAEPDPNDSESVGRQHIDRFEPSRQPGHRREQPGNYCGGEADTRPPLGRQRLTAETTKSRIAGSSNLDGGAEAEGEGGP